MFNCLYVGRVLLGAAVLAGAPQSAPRVPSEMVGLYYTKEFTSWLAKAEAAGTFDPNALGEGVPVSVSIQADGQLVILEVGFAGMETSCRIERIGGDQELSIDAKCGDDARHYRWRWLSASEVETDMLKNAEKKHPVMVRVKESFNQLVARHAADAKAKLLPKIVGRYSSSDGSRTIVIEPGGLATVGGRRVGWSILSCREWSSPSPGTDDGEPPRAGLIQLDPDGFKGKAGEYFARFGTGGVSLVEGIQGAEAEGFCGGCCYAKPAGQTLHRVEASKPAK